MAPKTSASLHRTAGQQTTSSARSTSRPSSKSSIRAASGLILASPEGPALESSQSGTRNSTVNRTRGTGGRTVEPRKELKLKVGEIIEVVEEFTTDEKILGKGKIPGVLLCRGQKGRIARIDEDGEACISFPELGQAVFIGKSNLERLRVATARSAASPEDMVAYRALLAKQEDKLAAIRQELRREKRKVGHWAWWVFPTEKEGENDPAATRVTRSTAAMLLKNASTAQEWRSVLESICDLVEERGARTLPAIDHPRVKYFIQFWSALDASPEWMRTVCTRLDRFEWQ